MKAKIVLLPVMVVGLLLSSFFNSTENNTLVENEKTPLVNENVDAFVQAQKILNHEAYVDTYNETIANIIVSDNYNKNMLIIFDYLNNRINSISNIKRSNEENDKRNVKKANQLLVSDSINEYSYDNSGRLTTIKRPTSNLTIEYNNSNKIVSQSINNKPILKNDFTVNGSLAKQKFINGSVIEQTYNDSNQLINIKENNSIVAKYTYDENSKMSSFLDLKTNTKYDYIYEADILKGVETNKGLVINYQYDENNEAITSRKYNLNNTEIITEIKENGVSTTDFEINVIKDISDRPIIVDLETTQNYNYVENYNYEIFEPTYESLTEETYEEALNNKTNDMKIDSFSNNFINISYEYDNEGNIVSEMYGDNNRCLYTYDFNGELSHFSGHGLNETYSYDSNGNLTNINGYALQYDMSTGFDLLTSYLGYSFQYDNLGNPLVYKNHNLSWFGKKLASFDGVVYTYNPSGIRTSKVSNGIETSYYLEGDKVIYETQSDQASPIIYLYNNNEVIGLKYKGQNYYYMKNPQNDVLGIFDSNGVLVVKYTYNPWGKVLNISGSLKDTLGKDNPYRFKSYRYDSDIGMYYLNSRYYDPEIGRFINADSIENLQYTIMNDNYSKNLYMYSFNNPINKYDPSGNMAVGVLNGLKFLYSDLKLVPDYAISTPCLVFNANNLYIGFHETAQLVAAKTLSKHGYRTELEYKYKEGATSKIDILAYKGRNYIYEVKPVTCSYATAYKQILGYKNATGFAFGSTFPTQKIDFLPKIEMEVKYESNGIVRYTFYKNKWKWFNKYVKAEVMESNLINKIKIGFWVGVAIAGVVIAATLIEDVVTAGAGVANDAASVGIAAGGFRGAVAFGLAFI